MPLTEFQKGVLRLLAANRGPESFVAGGVAINAGPNSPRYSADVDVFHDAEENVAKAAAADVEVLIRAGFAVERLIDRPAFQRVLISRDEQTLRLEWTQDSAFRFFSAQRDEEFGWRLHLADLATNKILALAGRWKARDFVDTLYLDGTFASLGLMAWAASGKDPGLTPMFILEAADRFNRLQPEDFRAVIGAGQLDLAAMKTRWRESLNAARELVAALPLNEVGALYLDADDQPVDPRFALGARIHYASLGGSLPQVLGSPAPLPEEIEHQADHQIRQSYQQDHIG